MWLAPDIGGAIAAFHCLGVHGFRAAAADQERLLASTAAQAVAEAISASNLYVTLLPFDKSTPASESASYRVCSMYGRRTALRLEAGWSHAPAEMAAGNSSTTHCAAQVADGRQTPPKTRLLVGLPATCMLIYAASLEIVNIQSLAGLIPHGSLGNRRRH